MLPILLYDHLTPAGGLPVVHLHALRPEFGGWDHQICHWGTNMRVELPPSYSLFSLPQCVSSTEWPWEGLVPLGDNTAYFPPLLPHSPMGESYHSKETGIRRGSWERIVVALAYTENSLGQGAFCYCVLYSAQHSGSTTGPSPSIHMRNNNVFNTGVGIYTDGPYLKSHSALHHLNFQGSLSPGLYYILK